MELRKGRKVGETTYLIRGRFCLVVPLVAILCLTAEGATGEEGGVTREENNTTKVSDSPVPQVRYRTRPVGAFRSTKSSNDSVSNDSKPPDNPGAPAFAVHDLTSQTFEKLHENWRNLETFLRNLQVRRSQEESQRSSPNGAVPAAGESRENNYRRFPPFTSNNVYTLRYHPVLEGQGPVPNPVDDGRGTHPSRTLAGGINNFNPYPYDPKGQGAKDVDMERHTIATIYTIGICLTIMAIGSVMFILINKCDGSNTNYVRSGGTRGPAGHVGSRITRSMVGAVVAGNRAARQGRSRRGGGRSSSNNNNNDATSGGAEASGGEHDAKILTDLPPSYDSLFPEGGPHLKDVIVEPPQASTSTMTVSETNINLSLNSEVSNHTSNNSDNHHVSSNTQSRNASSSLQSNSQL